MTSSPWCADPGCTPRIRLFGTFRLTVDGRAVDTPLGVQRLLAVLALRERASRARLAGLLWPEGSQRQAMTNLRKACWRLQGAVPGHLLVVAAGHDLRLVPEVASDVATLVRAVHDRLGSDGPSAHWPPDPDVLDELVDPEAADLLSDWDDPWLEADRERLRQLRLHVLEDWAARLTDAGDYVLALEVALCALRADVLRESAHRAVIRVHRAEGNVQEARRAFAVCTAVLDREIGIAPSPATVALVP
ncbi:BTAD domain-containing putative transcriptional regulator [Oryzobacter telluris]|uniref:AfsR/SARP family transcriptional regulator n=1 Tax=Oryzobacter telluris TaxID=3149179 RepID=UPI00370DDCB9